MAAALLAVALVAVAVWDLREAVSRRQWREVAVYLGLWLVGAVAAVAGAAGAELPSLSRLLVRLLAPVSRWMP